MDATTGDVAGASVQIGDPITEKLLIDVCEAIGLYTAITDCGAGGLSSAIGEMAEGVGAEVDLAGAPLKYPGLRPWEVWLSEAQERMVVAVEPASWPQLQRLCTRHGVEATSLGVFTGDGVLHVRHGNTTVLRLDTRFLHDGRPQREMQAELPSPDRAYTAAPPCSDLAATLLALLRHPNIASKEAVIRRYDHEILGSTVVRLLVGKHADGHADRSCWPNPPTPTGCDRRRVAVAAARSTPPHGACRRRRRRSQCRRHRRRSRHGRVARQLSWGDRGVHPHQIVGQAA
jgi:phosphoribosylformylglycinamidine synthase